MQSDDIFDQIAEMEQKIQTLEEDIRKAEANATKAIERDNSEELKYWRTKEQQLRTEKEQLRTKEQQLREELARKELELRGAEMRGQIAEGLQSFAAAAWGSPQEVMDGWMQAPVGTCFLGNADLGSTLYVREAYIALKEKLEELKKEGTAHVVISGNPGFGKSWFALYMLMRWLGDRIPVLWHWQEYMYLFEGGVVRPLTAEEAKMVLGAQALPRLHYVADGASPVVTMPMVEQSLVAHSPDDSKYKEYLKPPGHLPSPLWMPSWEPHELEALRAKRFAQKVTPVKMQQLIGRRGPVPRLVLDYAHYNGVDVRIQDAIGSLLASDIKAATPSTTQASHRLVLIHPPGWRQGDFETHELTFLSTDIHLKVLQKLLDDMANDMAALLQLTRSSHAQLAAAVGAYFLEGQIHCTLRKGGSYHMRVCPRKGSEKAADESLLAPAREAHSSPSDASATDSSSSQPPAGGSDGVRVMAADCSEASSDSSDTALRPNGRRIASSKWEFDLPALPVHYISGVQDLCDLPAGDMYVQPPINFPAIDSIAILRGTAYLLQITQNVKHAINVGLLSVLACLPAHLEVTFVWALPAEVWAQQTFNRKSVPQIADLSRPASKGRTRRKKSGKTAKRSATATALSADDGTVAEARASGVHRQAIKELVSRDVSLVERRLEACKMQLKMSIPVICDASPALSQPPMQGRPQASLSTASSLARSAASALQGPRLGLLSFRQLPAWALSGPALSPARVPFGSCPRRRTLPKMAYTRQGTPSCAGGPPLLA